jgi:hypothetical protein
VTFPKSFSFVALGATLGLIVVIGFVTQDVGEPASLSAATTLGDAQGVPKKYTGHQYPMPVSCYDANGEYYDNPQSLPHCPPKTYGVFSASVQGTTNGVTVLGGRGGGKNVGEKTKYTAQYYGTPIDVDAGTPILLEWSCQEKQEVTYTYCAFETAGYCWNTKEAEYTIRYATSASGVGFNTGGALTGSTVVPFPSTNTTYELHCGTQPPQLLSLGDLPVLSITATPDQIPAKATSTIAWSVTRLPPGSCTVKGKGIDAATLSGSQVTPKLDKTTAYTMDCVSPYGPQQKIATVSIAPASAAVLTITADPTTVPKNGQSTITWSAQNVKNCTVSGPGIFAKTTSGSKKTDNLNSQATYSLNCVDLNDKAVAQTVQVMVVASACASTPTPGVCSFFANPTSVLKGGASTLTWSCPSNGNTSSTGTNFSTGGRLSGTAQVNPTADTTYSLTCNPSGGTGNATVLVTQPAIQITATPMRVRLGSNTLIEWSASGVVAGSCQVTKNGSSFATGESGSKSSTMSTTSVFTVTCTLPTGPISASVQVKLSPSYYEL